MASLSRICTIPRRIGEVNLRQINYVCGIYRVWLSGGGGGGGGFESFYLWYGGAGNPSLPTSQTGQLVNPVTLHGGSGGAVSQNGGTNGSNGSVSSLAGGRSSITGQSTGSGGIAASTVRNSANENPSPVYGKEDGRFSFSTTSSQPSPPYETVYVGRGGSSTQKGVIGGIAKAYRIG